MSLETQKALLQQLKNPFEPKFVKWRVGATNADKTKGIALAYVDSREVMKRLDDVMGLGNWQSKLTEVKDGFICEISLFIDGNWVSRSNAAGNTKVEAIKGGASDAFKRAASVWGVGRYLYYLPNVWVEIKQQGNSYVLAEIPELPEWAQPGKVENWQDVAEMEATLDSGADDLDVNTVVSNVDRIRAVNSIVELEELLSIMTKDEQLIYASQVAIKRRELLHNEEIGTDSSTSSAKK